MGRVDTANSAWRAPLANKEDKGSTISSLSGEVQLRRRPVHKPQAIDGRFVQMFPVRSFRKVAVAAALAVAAATASAAGAPPVAVKRDGVTWLVGQAVGAFAAPVREPGLVPIFSNLLPVKKYPNGTYFCCFGPTVAGPDNQYGVPEQWWAEAFTPTANMTVTKVEVGIGFAIGTNSVNMGLYSDAGGLPGTVLVSRDIGNLPAFGSCCITMSLKDRSGIPVTAGTQYWVVLGTDSSDTDFLGGWNDNTPDQVTRINQAENFGSGWQADTISPGVALAVWGK
jgi:hypothetical protein